MTHYSALQQTHSCSKHLAEEMKAIDFGSAVAGKCLLGGYYHTAHIIFAVNLLWQYTDYKQKTNFS